MACLKRTATLTEPCTIPDSSSSPCYSPSDKNKKRKVSDVEESTTTTKNVTFVDESDMEEVVVDSKTISEEERKAMYMTEADQRRIFLDISKTVNIIKELATNPHPTAIRKARTIEGIRGLESVISQRNSRRSRRMRAVVVAVLDRQLTHPIDESWVESIYRPLLTESKELARKRALRDEAEAKAAMARAGRSGCRTASRRSKGGSRTTSCSLKRILS